MFYICAFLSAHDALYVDASSLTLSRNRDTWTLHRAWPALSVLARILSFGRCQPQSNGLLLEQVIGVSRKLPTTKKPLCWQLCLMSYQEQDRSFREAGRKGAGAFSYRQNKS